jgi:hypothetical protein
MVVSDINVKQRLLYSLENKRVAVAQVEHTTVAVTVEPTPVVVQVTEGGSASLPHDRIETHPFEEVDLPRVHMVPK